MKIKTWRIEEETGYKPQFTFYEDFSIADHFGASAVRSTYSSAFNEWKDNCQALTELCLALNWKIWEHYAERPDLAEVYSDLWTKADGYATTHLKGENLRYYYETTD
jgi:hypothetical protein